MSFSGGASPTVSGGAKVDHGSARSMRSPSARRPLALRGVHTVVCFRPVHLGRIPGREGGETEFTYGLTGTLLHRSFRGRSPMNHHRPMVWCHRSARHRRTSLDVECCRQGYTGSLGRATQIPATRPRIRWFRRGSATSHDHDSRPAAIHPHRQGCCRGGSTFLARGVSTRSSTNRFHISIISPMNTRAQEHLPDLLR